MSVKLMTVHHLDIKTSVACGTFLARTNSFDLILYVQSTINYVGQGTKIFQYSTCPGGRVTYKFHSSCKHMRLSFKSVCNEEHKGVI